MELHEKKFENKGTDDDFHDPLKELADMGEIENAMIAKENIKFDVEISSSSLPINYERIEWKKVISMVY